MADYPAKPRVREKEPSKESSKEAPTRRSFVAVFPPEAVLESLSNLRSRLEPDLRELRWVASRNVHFTLRFFGDLSPEEIARAESAIDGVASRAAPFEVMLQGLGVFPSWKRPRVLWVGAAKGGELLSALARELEREFRAARLGKADRGFVPHLTLGRWRDGVVPLRAEAAANGVETIARFEVRRVALMESRLGRGGSTYTPLHEAALGDPLR